MQQQPTRGPSTFFLSDFCQFDVHITQSQHRKTICFGRQAEEPIMTLQVPLEHNSHCFVTRGPIFILSLLQTWSVMNGRFELQEDCSTFYIVKKELAGWIYFSNILAGFVNKQ